MTLGDLKERIEEMLESDPDTVNLNVYAVCDYGDRCHTKQLIKLHDPVVSKPYKTSYSATGLAVRDEEDGENGEAGGGKVVVFG